MKHATPWETFFALIMTLPIMGHEVMLPFLLQTAGRDAWISVLVSLPIALLMIIAIWRVKLQVQTTPLQQWMKEQFGPLISYPLVIVMALYLLFLSCSSIAFLSDFIKVNFYSDTPLIALIVFFSLGCFYAILKRPNVILRTAIILGILSMVTGISVTFLSTPMKDFRNLQPILEYGMSPVFWGAWLVLSMWTELLFLLIIPIKSEDNKKILRLWIVNIGVQTFMMITPIIGVITIFGLGFATSLTYPSEETLRNIHLYIVDRFDVYGLFLMTFGSYVRTILYFRLGWELLFSTKKDQQMIWTWNHFFMLLTFSSFGVIAWSLAKDHARIEQTITLYTMCGILSLLPILIWLMSWGKRTIAHLKGQTIAAPQTEK